MLPEESVDVLVVGAGPAGMSTALHLERAGGGRARRVLILERERHPRHKPCGGAITSLGAEVLAELGLGPERWPEAFRAGRLRIRFGDRAWVYRDDPALYVVDRKRFDHWLVLAGEERGLEVRQEEEVLRLAPRADHVEVATRRAVYRARVVVGADGSNGRVRREIFPGEPARRARLLEVLTPEDGEPAAAFRDGVAELDFTPLAGDLQGYAWDFPSHVDGERVMNRGLFDSRAGTERPTARLLPLLDEVLAERGRQREGCPVDGFPILHFDPGLPFAAHRVLLAGDAAGADPLFGEGIAFALVFGRVAAAAIADAFARDDVSFAGYRRQVLADPDLARLTRRRRLADRFYRRRYPAWIIRGFWRAAGWWLARNGWETERPRA